MAVGASTDQLESFLVNFVVEQTGYPPEVVELDADLEADLGIDSIKKAQLFGELQEYFEISTSATDLSLDDFPTLRHVLDFLSAHGHSSRDQAADREVSSFSPAAPAPARETKVNAPAVTSGELDLNVAENPSPMNSVDNASCPVSVTGTPYEIGHSHGLAYREAIGRILRLYAEAVGQSIDELPGALRCQDAFALLSPDQLDELQGIADAVEVPLANVLAHHFAVAEMLASTQHQAAAESESPDKQVRHTVHLPRPAYAAITDCLQLVAIERRPDNGLSHAAFVAVGTAVAVGGVNQAGVSISWSPDLEETTSPAADADLLNLLATTEGIEDAIDQLRQLEAVRSYQMVVADRGAQRIASIQRTLEQTRIISDVSTVRAGGVSVASKVGGGETSLALPDVLAVESLGQFPDETVDDAYIIDIDLSKGEFYINSPNSGRVRLSLAPLWAQTPRLSSPPRPLSTGGPLADPRVTARFELEMREAPLATSPDPVPKWHGAAIVLGSGETAVALTERLQREGVTVHPISGREEADAALAQVEAICQAGPAPHLFITTARDQDVQLTFTDLPRWQRQQHRTMELPLLVCQKWLTQAEAGGWLAEATLAAVTHLGGDFGLNAGSLNAPGGALTGLLKAIFIEYTVMRPGAGPLIKVLDTAAHDTPQIVVETLLKELASGNLDCEISYTGGVRRVPYAIDVPARPRKNALLPQGVWVVTGGARGITAACALELGKRYGLRLHLLGTSPLPQIDPAWRNLDEEGLGRLKAETMIAARRAGKSAPEAWQQIQKSLEIDRSMRAFAEAGVPATYHVCNVSDRNALEAILDRIRQTDGPISGILHGAGIDKSCRMEKKRREVVSATISAKAGGAVHLAALTRRDPIRHFLAFGSIAGRLGSFGQADYCLASDLVCKLMGAYRQWRPWTRAVGFHWHGWDEVGMAARPETQSILREKSELTLMPLAEGLGHLIREIEADAPRSEVLITERRHWQRFADGLGKLAAGSHPPASSIGSPPETKSAAPLGPPGASVELRTQRCELKLIKAPLAPNSPAAPTFDSPVWILGENRDALALEQRLLSLGAEVHRISASGDLETRLEELQTLHPDRTAKYLFLMTSRDAESLESLADQQIQKRREEGIIAPFFVAQTWYKRLLKDPHNGLGTLVAAVSLGGDLGFESTVALPDGGGVAGFVKSLYIEDSRREQPRVRCKVIDMPASTPPASFVDALLREVAADKPEVEVCWQGNVRHVVRPIPTPLTPGPDANIPQGGLWVVTGGARGITAIAARELAAKYGWKLHLLGKSPPPLADPPWRHFDQEQLKTYKTQITREAVSRGQSPGAAWDRVLKDCEIHNNLQKFAEAGVSARYHQCDVTDRHQLAQVLEEIRRADGPITGLIHGAGLIEPGRFENKRRGFVEQLIRTKFDGLLHLLDLTQHDPLTHCIGFGSISGRFGGNGLSDYAAGNDAMAKALDWFRVKRPECTTLCIHWESWEGAGIATLSRFAWGPRSVMKMKYMQPEEGVRRLEEELARSGLKAETLYTFGDFYPMFYPAEQYPLGEFAPGWGEEAGSQFPLISTISHKGDEWIGAVPLDPVEDPFLALHRLRGKPLMPVVATLEALREAAELASGRQVIGFRQIDMVDGLLFHTDQPQTAQACVRHLDENGCEVRLTCDFRNRSGGLIQKDRLYLKATAELADAPAVPAGSPPPFPTDWHPVTYPEDSAIYHGAPFRCLKAISSQTHGGWGHIVAQPLVDLTGASRQPGWQVPSCVLDSALYACGCHLYLQSDAAVSLPRKIERLELGRPVRDGENCYVHFTCRGITDKAACYDLTLFGDDGSVILRATGYEKVILHRGGTA